VSGARSDRADTSNIKVPYDRCKSPLAAEKLGSLKTQKPQKPLVCMAVQRQQELRSWSLEDSNRGRRI
jgi:hypothetical protein